MGMCICYVCICDHVCTQTLPMCVVCMHLVTGQCVLHICSVLEVSDVREQACRLMPCQLTSH